MKKADIITFLQSRGVPADQLPPHLSQTIVELSDLAATVVVYEIDALAASFGIQVVFLPVAHPELNPIEKAWAICKNIVKSRNGVEEYQPTAGFTMANLQLHIGYAISQITPMMWAAVEDKCIEMENNYLQLAGIDDAVTLEEEEEEEEEEDGLW